MKINVGDMIIFPGMNGAGEAYLVYEADSVSFKVGQHNGQHMYAAPYDMSEAIDWFKRGTHKLISDEKEKLAYMLKYPEKVI